MRDLKMFRVRIHQEPALAPRNDTDELFILPAASAEEAAREVFSYVKLWTRKTKNRVFVAEMKSLQELQRDVGPIPVGSPHLFVADDPVVEANRLLDDLFGEEREITGTSTT